MICLIEMELGKSVIFGERREEGSSLSRAFITVIFSSTFLFCFFFQLVRLRADKGFLHCLNHTLYHAKLKENIPLK